MCLITRNQKQIATEDITCYKVLNDDLTAIYYSHNYVLGTKYEQPIEESNDWCVADRHSVVSLEREIDSLRIFDREAEWYSFNANKRTLYDAGFRCYGKGFHSFASLERAESSGKYNNQEFYTCIIPAGSEYIIDNDECIVSNQIIIKE